MDDPIVPRRVPGHPGDRPAIGWGHFLEQRVGKTPTLLNEFALLRRDYDFKWLIMLAPNAFKRDWPIEAEKFGLDAPAIALESTKREQVQRFVDKNKAVGGLIAVNYEALNQKPTMALLHSIMGSRTMIAADESITIKNPSSWMFKAAIELAKLSPVRRVLSGKPMSQGAHDLWAQLRFIAQANGIDSTVFKKRFTEMGGFMGKAVVGVKNEEELQEMLARCSWDARKIDWLKTPGKDYPDRPRFIQMLPEQERQYVSMQRDFLVELVSGEVVSADQVITKLIKLQQISSGFIIDEDRNTHELMPPDKNPKVIELVHMLEEEICLEREGGKVIINCVSQYSLDMLEKMLAKWQPAVIRGQEWHRRMGRDLLAEKARYNGDKNCRVMLGQEQALRYGHTLMGTQEQPCLNLFMYENSYSLNDRSQVEERPQGAGQVAPVTIWDFVASPQEMRVIEALQAKEDIVATVMQYARETGVLPRQLT